MEEGLADSLMEDLNQHTDVLMEKEISEQHTEMFPKEKEALRPYVFYFNNCFVSAGLVVDAGKKLAQMSNQIKMKEENFVEVFNPWNRDVQLLERMLDNQDSIQKEIIMKEGKDEMEAKQVKISKEKVSVGKRVSDRIRQLQREEHQFEELVDNSNNLKQRERGNNKQQSMDQPKDVLEMEIEKLWQLMMKQSIWRRLIATERMINQNLNLIDKERKIKQKTVDIQQQQRRGAFRQLQTKVWNPGGFLSTYEDT